MKRVRLVLVPSLEVEFVDRDRAIGQVYEFAEKGTRFPIVVFGPEGYGKSAWLRQEAEILKEQNFDVIHIDVIHKEFITYTDAKEVVERLKNFLKLLPETTDLAPVKVMNLVILLANQLLKRWRKKIVLLIDEVFQAIGLDKAEVYVKMLLNLIEYPPAEYEKIIVVIATSEGLSRWRIGRHRWADVVAMWNMSKRGFKELYEKIPKPKPEFDDI